MIGTPELPNVKCFGNQDFVLGKDSPVIPYREGRPLNGVHWGQLKLLATEIYFLNEYYDPAKHLNPVVVYAGAAGGHHIRLFEAMFPKVRWELYDPAKFEVKASDKITIHNQFFDHETCEEIKTRAHNEGWDLFFFSDIRIVPTGADQEALAEMKEDQVGLDMKYQMEWYNILCPIAGMLKFRIPFNITEKAEEFEYLKGKILIQPYPGNSSTETRLLVEGDPPDIVHYSSRWYEQALAYHNAVVRQYIPFATKITPGGGDILPPTLLGDYDGAWFTTAIIRYFEIIHKNSGGRRPGPTRANVIKLLSEIFENLDRVVYGENKMVQYRVRRLLEIRDSIEEEIRRNLEEIRDPKVNGMFRRMLEGGKR